MKRRDIYDIMCFEWNKETNTFYGDAWVVGIENTAPFIIKNYATDNYREFKFYKELPGYWIFKSDENEFTCEICLDPEGSALRDRYESFFG